MFKSKNCIFYTAVLIVAAVVLTWLLEFRYFIHDFGATWNFVFAYTPMFLFNAFLMLLILILVTGIVHRPWWAIGITASLVMIVTYIHINKYASRGTPLLPEDFQLASQAASLAKFVDVWGVVWLAVMVLLMLGAAVGLDYLTRKKLGATKEKHWKERGVLVVASVIVFLFSTSFIRHHDGSKYQYISWLNTTFTAWNQNRNYDENGFIVGFLYNWSKFNLAEPEGYNEEEIAEAKSEYSADDSELASLDDADYDIVVVLNESFYDPSIIEEYYPHTGGDVTPNLHNLMAKYPSGWMYTLDYGGGTANIEFETLTGLTNYWINTVPYTDLIPKAGDIPSIASYAKEHGYTTTAIHPYNGGMYKRNISLANEGFETFITETEMTYTEHEGSSEYINDWSSYHEVLDTLANGDGKQMVFLITMQNHTPYNYDTYAEHDFALQNLDDDPERKQSIETYYQSLYNSDKYLGEFIEELKKSERKTVVLFFGDHSAGLFHELNDSENSSTEFTLSRTTPYFIYSNFELTNAQKDLPNTTPNCLVNTLYNTLGIQKPALNYLLDEVCAEQPILAATYFGDNELIETETLKKYQLVTYDLLGGKKYWMNN